MKNRKHTRRVKRLALICTLCTIILVVSTYAWFIGMRSVAVSSFDVEIATTDSLLLSLDGKKWATQVNINKSNFNDTSVVYEGNTNKWAGEKGLILKEVQLEGKKRMDTQAFLRGCQVEEGIIL